MLQYLEDDYEIGTWVSLICGEQKEKKKKKMMMMKKMMMKSRLQLEDSDCSCTSTVFTVEALVFKLISEREV
jgi:hypothetical protein